MKSEELRALRADKIRLEEKLADFDQMKQSLQKATALVEDLKAQIDAKNNLERWDFISTTYIMILPSFKNEFNRRKC